MPADTPAAVAIRPVCTIRLSGCGSAPSSARVDCTIQCVVAGCPASMPAAARISEPEHTDVVHLLVRCTWRSHAMRSLSRMAGSVPVSPPGTSTMSGAGVSANEWVAPSTSTSSSVTTGPGAWLTRRISTPGANPSTW